jgi:hypothetical protein
MVCVAPREWLECAWFVSPPVVAKPWKEQGRGGFVPLCCIVLVHCGGGSVLFREDGWEALGGHFCQCRTQQEAKWTAVCRISADCCCSTLPVPVLGWNASRIASIVCSHMNGMCVLLVKGWVAGWRGLFDSVMGGGEHVVCVDSLFSMFLSLPPLPDPGWLWASPHVPHIYFVIL